MPKILKTAVGLLLLPVCAGMAMALVRVVRAAGDAPSIWVALLSGAVCWWMVFVLLPKPMWIYVVGHELTQVLWSGLFGGRLKRFQATSRGGQVVVTRTNFLVALAPYFFPLYVIALAVLFWFGNRFWEWTPFRPGFHFMIGMAYAFHVTLTWHVLGRSEQSDLKQHGYFFSIVVICLGNLLVLLVGIPLLTGRVGVLTAMDWSLKATADFLGALGGWL